MSKPKNLITDIPSIKIGNVHDERLGSGVTAILFDAPTVASCAVMGGELQQHGIATAWSLMPAYQASMP